MHVPVSSVEVVRPITIEAHNVQPFESDYCVYENGHELQQIVVFTPLENSICNTSNRRMVENEMEQCKKYYLPVIIIIGFMTGLVILIVIVIYLDIYG